MSYELTSFMSFHMSILSFSLSLDIVVKSMPLKTQGGEGAYPPPLIGSDFKGEGGRYFHVI